MGKSELEDGIVTIIGAGLDRLRKEIQDDGEDWSFGFSQKERTG